MYGEPDVIYSMLEQNLIVSGVTLAVNIFRLPNTGWTLEIADEFGYSTRWDDEFETDEEALRMALEAIDAGSIELFLGNRIPAAA